MNLLKQARVAIANVIIAHLKRDLSDYEKVLELYNPNVPLFEVIIKEVEQITAKIRYMEDYRNEDV